MSLVGTTIYKMTALGQTQVWSQEIEGDKYRTHSGKLGGKIVVSKWTQCFPTNVGRSNERSAEQQAIFEVEANYKLKLDKEYHTDINNIKDAAGAKTQKVFLPMLAKNYDDLKDFSTLQRPVFIQPKLDGKRCIATKDGLFSRNGKPIVGVPHIQENVLELLKVAERENIIFDGELYNHAYKDDFNTIISNASKKKPTAEDLIESKKVIQYHIYDCYSSSHSDWPFMDRCNFLRYLSRTIATMSAQLFEHIQFVVTIDLYDEHDITGHKAWFERDGYEGAMVRANTPYETKRSGNLLKCKSNMSEEFELVDIEEGSGNWEGLAKSAMLKKADGTIFSASIAGNQEWCGEVLANKHLYIGKPTTVQFFNYTPDGIPRFGVVKEFAREDHL